MTRFAAIARWTAVFPLAVLSGIAIGLVVTFAYTFIPGLNDIWRGTGTLPASASLSSAFLCFIAAATALIVGTLTAPSGRKTVLVILAVILTVGIAFQAVNAWELLMSTSRTERDAGILSMSEAGGFFSAVLLCLGMGLSRRESPPAPPTATRQSAPPPAPHRPS